MSTDYLAPGTPYDEAIAADALRRWALMYPIPAWSLAEGEGAERLAGNWARVAARMVAEALPGAGADADQSAVTDDEVAALRAEITTGWWEVDEPGRDQALARLDRIAAELVQARVEIRRLLHGTGHEVDDLDDRLAAGYTLHDAVTAALAAQSRLIEVIAAAENRSLRADRGRLPLVRPGRSHH